MVKKWVDNKVTNKVIVMEVCTNKVIVMEGEKIIEFYTNMNDGRGFTLQEEDKSPSHL